MEIKAPIFPESIADGSVATWHFQPGDFVARDALLVDIETDKVVIEVFAPEDGVLQSILKNEGDTVLSEEPIAQFTAGATTAAGCGYLRSFRLCRSPACRTPKWPGRCKPYPH